MLLPIITASPQTRFLKQANILSFFVVVVSFPLQLWIEICQTLRRRVLMFLSYTFLTVS